MFAPTEEQEMLRDAAARLARDVTAQGLPERRDPPEVWESAADLGWLALPFEEADGGLGGGVAEIAVLTEELGRALLAGSYAVTTILAGHLVAASPRGRLRGDLIEALQAGAARIAVADAEPRTRGGCSDLATRARRTADGWVLDGQKTNVWVGDATRTLLVSAVAAEPGDHEMLVALPVDAPGLELREFDTVDRGRAAYCLLVAAPVPESAVLAPPSPGVRDLREHAWDLAAVAAVAECVGIMKALLPRTAEYLSARKQFNQPLAKFQVLRHRMADMALACRRAELSVEQAVSGFARSDPAERVRLVSAACVAGFEGARFVAEQSVQLHGGMGVSAELPIGKYLRRVIALQATFGFAAHHRARFEATESFG